MIWTEDAKSKFLGALAATGLIGKSAKAAGVSRRTIEDRREKDDEFAALCEEALEDYAETVEEEIHRRGVEGVDKGVYHNGERVATEKVYSDKMLELQAKSRMPKYREKGLEVDVNMGGVLVVGAPEQDLDAWRDKANKEETPDEQESEDVQSS